MRKPQSESARCFFTNYDQFIDVDDNNDYCHHLYDDDYNDHGNFFDANDGDCRFMQIAPFGISHRWNWVPLSLSSSFNIIKPMTLASSLSSSLSKKLLLQQYHLNQNHHHYVRKDHHHHHKLKRGVPTWCSPHHHHHHHRHIDHGHHHPHHQHHHHIDQ